MLCAFRTYFLKNFRKHFQICAAVAAAAEALRGVRAAGLGTATRGPPPRQRRLHKLKILEILKFLAPKILVRNWSIRTPNGPRTDPERIPNESRTEPEPNPRKYADARFTHAHTHEQNETVSPVGLRPPTSDQAKKRIASPDNATSQYLAPIKVSPLHVGRQ